MENEKTYNERQRESKKKYREKNRDLINEKKRERIDCICGSSISRSHVARHEKTNKHVSIMAQLDQIEENESFYEKGRKNSEKST